MREVQAADGVEVVAGHAVIVFALADIQYTGRIKKHDTSSTTPFLN